MSCINEIPIMILLAVLPDATTALKGGPEKPMKEKELIDAALSALRSDGNVLMPVDTAGRVLEALLIFDRHWCASSGLGFGVHTRELSAHC